MFQAVGSGSKWRARVPSSGVGLEMAGLHLKQWGEARSGGLAFEAVGSGSKRWARIQSSGVQFETAGLC